MLRIPHKLDGVRRKIRPGKALWLEIPASRSARRTCALRTMDVYYTAAITAADDNRFVGGSWLVSHIDMDAFFVRESSARRLKGSRYRRRVMPCRTSASYEGASSACTPRCGFQAKALCRTESSCEPRRVYAEFSTMSSRFSASIHRGARAFHRRRTGRPHRTERLFGRHSKPLT